MNRAPSAPDPQDPHEPTESVRSPEVVLETRGLRAGYVEADVLKGVDLKVRDGEIVTIIGPNGAGKSTLIKVVAGLLPARAGEISFQDEDITNHKAHEIVARGLGYVPQLDNIFPTLTVQENLEMGAFLHPKKTERRLEEVYGFFPMLKERRRARGGSLSGGQRQMVAFGRALMGGPSLLVLDEPSAGLAPTIVDEIFETIQRMNREGLTILLVEQNARRAMALSHFCCVLDLGRNRFEGPGEEMLKDPKVLGLYLGGGERLQQDLEDDD